VPAPPDGFLRSWARYNFEQIANPILTPDAGSARRSGKMGDSLGRCALSEFLEAFAVYAVFAFSPACFEGFSDDLKFIRRNSINALRAAGFLRRLG
jgi:hypothetical protein